MQVTFAPCPRMIKMLRYLSSPHEPKHLKPWDMLAKSRVSFSRFSLMKLAMFCHALLAHGVKLCSQAISNGGSIDHTYYAYRCARVVTLSRNRLDTSAFTHAMGNPNFGCCPLEARRSAPEIDVWRHVRLYCSLFFAMAQGPFFGRCPALVGDVYHAVPRFQWNKRTRNTMSVSNLVISSVFPLQRSADWLWDSLAQVPSQGCSNGCNIRTENILATQPCEDQTRGDVWKEFRDGCSVDLVCTSTGPCNLRKIAGWDGASLGNQVLEVFVIYLYLYCLFGFSGFGRHDKAKTSRGQ